MALIIVEIIASVKGVDPSSFKSETGLASDLKASAPSQSGVRRNEEDAITAMILAIPALAVLPGKFIMIHSFLRDLLTFLRLKRDTINCKYVKDHLQVSQYSLPLLLA